MSGAASLNYIMTDEKWRDVARRSGLFHDEPNHLVGGAIGDVEIACRLVQQQSLGEVFHVTARWPFDLELMVPELGEPTELSVGDLLSRGGRDSASDVISRARAVLSPHREALKHLLARRVDLSLKNRAMVASIPLAECSPERLSEIIGRVAQVAQSVATERPAVEARSDLRSEASLLEPLARELELCFSTCPLGMSGCFEGATVSATIRFAKSWTYSLSSSFLTPLDFALTSRVRPTGWALRVLEPKGVKLGDREIDKLLHIETERPEELRARLAPGLVSLRTLAHASELLLTPRGIVVTPAHGISETRSMLHALAQLSTALGGARSASPTPFR